MSVAVPVAAFEGFQAITVRTNASHEGRRIGCPALAASAAGGALDNWYAGEGQPLALWSEWCDDVQGCAIEGGHFFPETRSEATAELLSAFFAEA